MSLCPHGIRIEHKRCDRCEEIAEAEHKARCRDEHGPTRQHLNEETHGDQELRVGWKDKPLELRIEGTHHALTLVQHLISQALSMTTEANTVAATHQKTGAKIVVHRIDIK